MHYHTCQDAYLHYTMSYKFAVIHSCMHIYTVEDYVDIILEGADEYECTPPCTSGLGTCIPPGFCACDKGWKGVTCDVGMYNLRE